MIDLALSQDAERDRELADLAVLADLSESESADGLRAAWSAGLAANPAAPSEVLCRLLALDPLPDGGSWLPVRELPRAAAEVAARHPDPTARAYLVEHPGLPADLLAALAGDRSAKVRRAALLSAMDRGVELRPEALALLAADRDPRTRRVLACYRGLPPELLARLAADPDPSVRAATAVPCTWLLLPSQAREALERDADQDVRTAVRRVLHPEPPLPRTLPGYLAETDPDRRLRTAAGQPVDGPLAEWLLLDEDARVRAAAAGNPHLPTGLALALGSDEAEEVRLAVSLREDLTEAQRAAITLTVPEVRFPVLPWVVARYGDEAELRRLARSAHPVVRRSVAAAEHLPADVVELLAADPVFMVRLTLAERCAEAPHELLLAVYREWHGRSWDTVVSHPNFARPGLARLAGEPDPRLRLAALHDPVVPPSMVAALAADPAPMVALAAARHPRLPRADLLRLLGPGGAPRAAAANPALPRAWMHRLLDLASAG